ncbi:hydroxymethylglutaryl-CoA reductase [Candidatus Gottesmanbacteria bacterium]|nr:hydroxymethylglutaryl-CoA reductase [Candidatus Gottesmanbacteria bacterium]
MNIRSFKSGKDRREALGKEVGVSLANIGSFSLDEAIASSRNCENMIGIAQIPMGVAGPLRITNRKQEHDYYLPLATTEGALVASINRGCKAITQSGGATVAVESVGVTRGPVFATSGIIESLNAKKWIDTHVEELGKVAAKTSLHLGLKKLRTRVVGKNVYVRFFFDTQDAMGMNMATIATTSMYRYIEVKTRAKGVSVAGNFDIDKKPAWLNSISGRGKRVWAEVTIPSKVLKKTLKTTAKKVYDVWLAKCMIGSAISGSLGFNAQFANVIAAIFLATGQDMAHVVEGSLGITTCEVLSTPEVKNSSHLGGESEESLYVSIYLPDIMVGTVGGGTGLATQKEALSILGVAGGNEGKNAQKFAEVIGAAVLAGEISLLASLEEGTLAQAHQRLARGKSK